MSKLKILVVEDEMPVRNLIRTTLETHEYTYLSAEDGKSALMLASSVNPDLILLDLGLPDMDGIEIIRRIRTWSNMPIIVLTARSEVTDKILALDCGADDYLTKPFQSKELLARLRALGRRNAGFQDNSLSYGDLSLDTSKAVLTCQTTGQSVRLGEKELRILEYMFGNKGQIMTREQLAVKIWGFENEAEYNNVEVYMSFTRKKLAFVGSRVGIKAVRGLGYELRMKDV